MMTYRRDVAAQNSSFEHDDFLTTGTPQAGGYDSFMREKQQRQAEQMARYRSGEYRAITYQPEPYAPEKKVRAEDLLYLSDGEKPTQEDYKNYQEARRNSINLEFFGNQQNDGSDAETIGFSSPSYAADNGGFSAAPIGTTAGYQGQGYTLLSEGEDTSRFQETPVVEKTAPKKKSTGKKMMAKKTKIFIAIYVLVVVVIASIIIAVHWIPSNRASAATSGNGDDIAPLTIEDERVDTNGFDQFLDGVTNG